ncbi:hypothetical protein [Idiomarina aminovorans]|uniref:hypothetical protein n=1 Tax=Idiomarina aminovorans TaxID=2914829 RepID=UPI002003C4F3|nr:hypothetical protein [Idiomarina sp. ATCH4]MCK7460308.1 hypothetical protein [Idiomarina sp. ATCH4]
MAKQIITLYHAAQKLITKDQHALVKSTNRLPDELKPSSTDYTVSGLKSVLGAVPVAGSLLSEIAGTVIPNQRVDRIADFARKLELRVSHLEHSFFEREIKNEEFTDLVEESLR